MRAFLCVLGLTSVLCAARAENAVPALELKEKSAFAAPDTRNPFWPIGWKKPDPKNPNAITAGPVLTPASFVLTSVTMGTGSHFAILNGKIMQEGQQFGVQLGKEVYPVTLKAIEDGQVLLVYQENEIVVPLRRK